MGEVRQVDYKSGFRELEKIQPIPIETVASRVGSQILAHINSSKPPCSPN